MPSTTPYEILAGNGRPLSVSMLDYDNISFLDLRGISLTTTPAGVEFLCKRSQSDTDPGARITKLLQIATVTIAGSPAGGAWAATIGGLTTADIPHDAAASAVKSALEAIASVGAGNSLVQGGPGPDAPWKICLINAAAGKAIAVAQSGTSPFTGGSSPAVSVATAGTITIPDAVNGHLVVPILPADTAGIQAQLRLEGEAKAWMLSGFDVTGWKGTLTIDASDILAP